MDSIPFSLSALFHSEWGTNWKRHSRTQQVSPQSDSTARRMLHLNILPKLERVFERSIIALLLGLFRTDLLAREMSAVTLVIDIL